MSLLKWSIYLQVSYFTYNLLDLHCICSDHGNWFHRSPATGIWPDQEPKCWAVTSLTASCWGHTLRSAPHHSWMKGAGKLCQSLFFGYMGGTSVTADFDFWLPWLPCWIFFRLQSTEALPSNFSSFLLSWLDTCMVVCALQCFLALSPVFSPGHIPNRIFTSQSYIGICLLKRPCPNSIGQSSQTELIV